MQIKFDERIKDNFEMDDETKIITYTVRYCQALSFEKNI